MAEDRAAYVAAVHSSEKHVGKLLAGNAADIMEAWPDGCVDLIITSPRYRTATRW